MFNRLIKTTAISLFLCSSSAFSASADYTNFIGMKFKTLPAGSFYMGSCLDPKKVNKKRAFLKKEAIEIPCPSGAEIDKKADEDEMPQHKVTLKKSFQMGLYEVTLGQFREFVIAADHDDWITNKFMKYNDHGDDAALSYVSWKQAQKFVTWLNENKPADDKGSYRLPSEAEWEYAARAGSKTHYSFGDSASKLGQYAWYSDNAKKVGEKYAHKVGQKKPNPWGLYDMHGNVWEWVEDCGHKSYQGAPTDGTAWTTECADASRVNRGGGWDGSDGYVRSANRYDNSPGVRLNNMGFRLLRMP